MLLVQYMDSDGFALCGLLHEGCVYPDRGGRSTYEFLQNAIDRSIAPDLLFGEFASVPIAFADLAAGQRLLPPITHPDPHHCLISGTGLTHRGSAAARDAMHGAGAHGPLTDTMRLFAAGEAGGKPDDGAVGVVPEWFYKGDGRMLVAPGAPLPMPGFALGDGEEPELALVYIIDATGVPRRVGSVVGNEFSDHVLERANYLYLAHSKLRHCAIGPALRLGDPADDIGGRVAIHRRGDCIWQDNFATGSANMTHSIANIEHHHFRYAQHRSAGDLHLHFLGTSVLSFAAGVVMEPGDTIEISADGYGPALCNPVVRGDEPTAGNLVRGLWA
jgi:hypothetical protein